MTPLDVTADLVLDVDGRRVTIVAAPGGPVRIDVADPSGLLTALRTVPLPVGVTPHPRRLARQAADRLADAGVQAVVSGPSGTLATVGHGVESATGRWVFGTRHVAADWRAASVVVPTRRVVALLGGLVAAGLAGGVVAGSVVVRRARR